MPFHTSCSGNRIDRDHSRLAAGVERRAAPQPRGRILHHFPFDRIAMHVVELFRRFPAPCTNQLPKPTRGAPTTHSRTNFATLVSGPPGPCPEKSRDRARRKTYPLHKSVATRPWEMFFRLCGEGSKGPTFLRNMGHPKTPGHPPDNVIQSQTPTTRPKSIPPPQTLLDRVG